MSQGTLPTRSNVEPVRLKTTASSRADTSSLLLELPVFRELAAKIGLCELRRRLVHMSPVFLPFLLWGIPHLDPWGPILVNFVLILTTCLVGLALSRFALIARAHEQHGMDAVIGYAIPIMLLVVLLPDRAELAMMTLGIVALGDGSATLGGLWFGGRRLPWNKQKSFAGLLSFCVCGTAIATVIYWGEARPGVSWQLALTCASISTLAAAFVESLPLPWNDNLRVGTTAALVGTFVQIVWLGR